MSIWVTRLTVDTILGVSSEHKIVTHELRKHLAAHGD